MKKLQYFIHKRPIIQPGTLSTLEDLEDIFGVIADPVREQLNPTTNRPTIGTASSYVTESDDKEYDNFEY